MHAKRSPRQQPVVAAQEGAAAVSSKTGQKLFCSLSGGIYWAVEGELWAVPKVLALEVPTYCAGRQAHKPLIVEQYGGPDVGVMSSMGVTRAGSNDFSLGDLGMAFQLKYPLLCETCSVLFGTSDHSRLCSLDFHCVPALIGECIVLQHALLYVCGCSLHRETLLLSLPLRLQGMFFLAIVMDLLSITATECWLLLISCQVSGETQSLGSIPSLSKYLSADSETGVCCAIY